MTATGGDGQPLDRLSIWIGSYRKYPDRRRDNGKVSNTSKETEYSKEYPT